MLKLFLEVYYRLINKLKIVFPITMTSCTELAMQRNIILDYPTFPGVFSFSLPARLVVVAILG